MLAAGSALARRIGCRIEMDVDLRGEGITDVDGHQPEPEPTTELQHGSALAIPYRPRLPAGRRGNGQIDRIGDALALDALVDESQSEPSLQLDDDRRLAASYRHQIAAIDLGPDCIASLLQQLFYGCV